jgi:hypothetical protein
MSTLYPRSFESRFNGTEFRHCETFAGGQFFIQPIGAHSRRLFNRLFRYCVYSLEFVLDDKDAVYARSELTGEDYVEICSPAGLHLIDLLLSFGSCNVSDTEQIALALNLHAHGSHLPWFPDLDGLAENDAGRG